MKFWSWLNLFGKGDVGEGHKLALARLSRQTLIAVCGPRTLED